MMRRPQKEGYVVRKGTIRQEISGAVLNKAVVMALEFCSQKRPSDLEQVKCLVRTEVGGHRDTDIRERAELNVV